MTGPAMTPELGEQRAVGSLAHTAHVRLRANNSLAIAFSASVLIHIALLSGAQFLGLSTSGVPPAAMARLAVTLAPPKAKHQSALPASFAAIQQRNTGSARHPRAARSTPAGADLPTPRETTTTPPLSDPPKIDLERARAVACASAQGSAKARDPRFDVAPPEREDEGALAKGVAKALRPDCRNAYSGAGLLAVPLLLRDTVSDHGCKW